MAEVRKEIGALIADTSAWEEVTFRDRSEAPISYVPAAAVG